MLYRNRVKEAIQSSGIALGTSVQIPSAENAEIAAAVGFDFVIINMEHGSFGIESLVNLIRSVQVAGGTPIARLPDDSESGILKALDAGAIGVLIPRVSNAEQARKIVNACRYAPLGTRGACPRIRATAHGLHDWEDHVKWSNDNIMVWILIESIEGFNNFEKIVTTPGLNAVALGPFDLSQEMGLGGQVHHPKVEEPMVKAITIAKENSVDIAITLFETIPKEIEDAAKRWASLGARILICGTDRKSLTIKLGEFYSALTSARQVKI